MSSYMPYRHPPHRECFGIRQRRNWFERRLERVQPPEVDRKSAGAVREPPWLAILSKGTFIEDIRVLRKTEYKRTKDNIPQIKSPCNAKFLSIIPKHPIISHFQTETKNGLLLLGSAYSRAHRSGKSASTVSENSGWDLCGVQTTNGSEK